MYALDEELMANLRDPRVTVPGFGHVLGQSEDQMVPYNVDAVCPRLQRSILSFLGAPPRDADGFTKWLLVVASRQTTKSTTTALGIANLVEYSPGTFGAVITDKRERSDDLFRSITINYQYKDPTIRYPSAPNREVRQLTFAEPHNGKLRTLAANQDNVGIGRGSSFLHCSELPFWNDPGSVWYQLGPSFRNRKNALVVMESTPAPVDEPGAEWFREMAEEAWMEKNNRFIFLFVPFQESLLNERSWLPEWRLDKEELKLLDLHGPKHGEPLSAKGVPYLTLENLAFRRTVMVEDPLVRRNPELFFTYYPVDPVTCWQQSSTGAIPSGYYDYLQHIATVPWERDDVYKEYEDPDPDAVYLLCFDPSGYGTGDPAAFHVLKVWADAPMEQVAEYETNQHDPPMQAYYVAKAAKRYNDAIVVAENNVQGALSLLQVASEANGLELMSPHNKMERVHIKNLYYYKVGKPDQRPGVNANRKTLPEAMGSLITALIDKIVIRGQNTFAQLASYRRDKDVQTSEKAKVVNPDREARGRRKKHHWDRVSALMWGCWAVERGVVPLRHKPVTESKPVERVRDLRSLRKFAAAQREDVTKPKKTTVKRSKYRMMSEQKPG